ncbi:dynein regulatory complex subunit 4-like [Rhodnius prolixus]
MGPKKKAGRTSKGGRGSGGIIDGVPMSDMPREHLEKYALRIREELEREREERNFFQLERDKLRTFWEITRQQQEENKAELRNKDRSLEEADERHQGELKVYNEKVKHLMYEHQSHLTEVKAENMVSLKIAQEGYQKQESILIEEKEELKKQIISEKLDYEEKLREITAKHSEEIYGIREEFMFKIKEMVIKAEKRLEKIREHFDLKNRMEISEIEERKNKVINNLSETQKKAIRDLKTYYTDVIDNNLAVISALKDELVSLKAENEEVQKLVVRLKSENKTLSKPLEEANKKVLELEKEASLNKKNKSSLMEMHKRYSAITKEMDKVVIERDFLESGIEKMEFEMNELKTHYTTLIMELQKQSAIEIRTLEKRIIFLEDEFEKKEIMLAQLICKANLDPNAVNEANSKMQQAMSRRAKKIEILQLELGRVVKAHDDMLDNFLSIAKEYKIPSEEIRYTHFKPLLKQIISDYLQGAD